jgi:hypothetical protein
MNAWRGKMRRSHTTTVTIGGKEIELELEVNICPAEHDVGIMSSYVDDFEITAVDGKTDKAIITEMNEAIEKEFGDEKFFEKIENEGAAEYDDYD